MLERLASKVNFRSTSSSIEAESFMYSVNLNIFKKKIKKSSYDFARLFLHLLIIVFFFISEICFQNWISNSCNGKWILTTVFPPNALCWYPNVKVAIRNLSLNTSTATVFLLFNYFRENIWVKTNVEFHFLYMFVGRVDRFHKTTNLSMLFFTFYL